MARPLSEEKRIAILNAAVDAVATLGLAAPTVKIARGAGVADGTLFVYFPTKETLLNELVLFIKDDLKQTVEAELVPTDDVERWLHGFWNRYIEWGLQSPEKYRAMRQLNASPALTDETRMRAQAMFAPFDDMIAEGLKKGVLRDQSVDFVGSITDAMATMVLERAQQDPGNNEKYRRLGWSALWHAISMG
jgi:AcrR family transcriptional regulator